MRVRPYMANGSLYDVLINTKAPQYRYVHTHKHI
jgi:hypothetical protein